VILDIGGNRPLSALRRAPTRRARLIIIGGETSGRLLAGTDRQLRAMALSPFIGQTLRTFVATEGTEDLAVLAELIEPGTVTPVIDRAYPGSRAIPRTTRDSSTTCRNVLGARCGCWGGSSCSMMPTSRWSGCGATPWRGAALHQVRSAVDASVSEDVSRFFG
jgi:hypothetical protein